MKKKGIHPSHMMGFKILEKQQLENMFPSCQSLLSKIEHHRKYLIDEKENLKSLDLQENMMFDNIYSIFGKRGSGKTSAIFTLKKIIEEKNGFDLVLPIIVHEMIPEHCDIMSWILTTLDQTIEQLEKEIQFNTEERENQDYFKDCHFKRNGNKLRKEYEGLKELCFSREYQSKRTSYLEYIGNENISTQNSYDFAKQLTDFWGTLIEAICSSKPEYKDKMPLIYIMFDDVDLAPMRITETISLVNKYLAHPNVVVIMTADEELLDRVVELDFRRKLYGIYNLYPNMHHYTRMIFSGNEERISKKLDENDYIINETAALYEKKVLPTSCRYYLENFDSCIKRSEFLICEDKKVTTIKDSLIRMIDQLLGTDLEEGNGQVQNFLIREDGTFNYAYMLLFGSTSRVIINEYNIIKNVMDQLKEINILKPNIEERAVKMIYQQIYYFIYNTFILNENFFVTIDEKKSFINHAWRMEKDKEQLYMDYEYIFDYYNKQITNILNERVWEEKNILNPIKELISIVVIFKFIENLLLKMNHQVIGMHRGNIRREIVLVRILDRIVEDNLSLVKVSDDGAGIDYIIENYAWILENLEILKDFSITNQYDVMDYMYSFGTYHMLKHIDDPEVLSTWCWNNPVWFGTMTQMCHLMFNGVYFLTELEWSNLHLKTEHIYDTYIRAKGGEITNDLEKFLNQINLEQENPTWEEILGYEYIATPVVGWEKGTLQEYREKKKVFIKQEKSVRVSSYGSLIKDILSELGISEELYTSIKKQEEMVSQIYKKITDLVDSFTIYHICEKEKLLECIKILGGNNWNMYFQRQIWAFIELCNRSEKIEAKKIKNIIDMIFEEYKYQQKAFVEEDIEEQGNMRATLKQVGYDLPAYFDILLENTEDRKRADELIKWIEIAKIVNKKYLGNLLKHRKEVEKAYIFETDKMKFFQQFEEAIQEIQNSDHDGYLKLIIEDNIKAAVEKMIEYWQVQLGGKNE